MNQSTARQTMEKINQRNLQQNIAQLRARLLFSPEGLAKVQIGKIAGQKFKKLKKPIELTIFKRLLDILTPSNLTSSVNPTTSPSLENSTTFVK